MSDSQPVQSMPSDGAPKLRSLAVVDEVEYETDPGSEGPGPSRLENLAAELARSHAISRGPLFGPSPFDRLEELESLLHSAYEFFARESETQGAVSGAAEWLLDNFYVVQQTLRQIGEDMPKGYYRQLPKLKTSSLQGYPRIYALARELIGYREGQLDLDRMTRFVRAYQDVTPLTMGELWALPSMLRLGVVEQLAQTTAHVVKLQKTSSKSLLTSGALFPHLTNDTVVATCILNLRSLAAQDWKTFVESVSRVEDVLRLDPAGIYGRIDFETRDRYRKVVEELARATGRDEEETARGAIRLAQEPQQNDLHSLRTIHVGYYLLDTGRARLEARLGYHPRFSVRARRWLLDHPLSVYLGAVALPTVVITLIPVVYALAVGGTLARLIGAACLSVLPASAIAISLANLFITHIVPPRVLPKLDLSAGIPAACRTAVVIPALLPSVSVVKSLLQQLELHFLSNPDPHLHFALLTDFADAPQEHMPADDAVLDQARLGIEALNDKYGHGSSGPFYLFHRERQWNPAENCWMGWERKRGKLFEFNRLLTGDSATSFSVQVGDLGILTQVKYVITLDSDTTLPRGAASRLIATLAHPLNRAEFDPIGGTVTAGYTVLQPRVEIKPTSANQTLFTQVFSGDSGVDLYTLAISDVYQDLFGEGIYVGKGIYDVSAFERSLSGRAPDNALLSHDLFEGIHGRAGLVTDVTLFEEYPPNYLTHALRMHRWVRGDWQLLPWLLPKVPHADQGKITNDLSPLGYWKILDNLRRSLLAPALLAWFIAGWFWLPGSALVWTLAGLTASAMPLITNVGIGAAQRLRFGSLSGGASLLPQAIRWLLMLAFLPYEALLMVDAIVSTVVRLTVTHKRLLQWTTAAHTIRLFGKERQIALLWRQMSGAPLMALALALLLGLLNPETLPVAAPLLVGWLVSPQIASWIGRPITRQQVLLSADERQQLRNLARRTWLYFEQFVSPDDHWLPPDHFQEKPRGGVAHRTSPTNLGLLLLSTMAAYDLGYVNPMDLVLRLSASFDGMNELGRYRGHFLNWYDTQSLKPLPPQYVSTVDSGNLAACLLALKQGLIAVPREPVWRWQRWQGLLDALGVLTEIVEGLTGMELEVTRVPLVAHLGQFRQEVLAVQDDPARWAPLLVRLLADDQQRLRQLLMACFETGSGILDAATAHSLRIWAERVQYHLIDMRAELDMFLPWVLPMSQPPALFTQAETLPAVTEAWQALAAALPITASLNDIAEVCKEGQRQLARLQSLLNRADGPADRVQETRSWCAHLADDLSTTQFVVGGLLAGYQNLSRQAETCFQAMDFSFLFDARRQVFHLGYDVAAEKLDDNHYDLLASEARIAGLVAIAKGDIPQSHWLHLDRTLTQVDGMRALLSWNGSMFEYLMPSLLMRSYEGALLDQTCQGVVHRQITYARQESVPWGISESGYYRFDANMNYQYRGFGVPGLGLKRGLSEDLVIAPYASLLALSLEPRAVMQNVAHLTQQGILGYAGFYEAVDYTPARLGLGHKSEVVYAYMAHHQGMSLLALTNYLMDEVIVNRFHTDPRVRSVELLLQEQVPQQVLVEHVPEEMVGVMRPSQAHVDLGPWRASIDTSLPQVHFLSNGRYGVLITGAGSGYSCWQDVDLTRWRPDTTLDDWGTWIYVQDMDSDALWSAGYQPTGSREDMDVRFYAHKAEFRRRDHDISLRLEVAVAPGDDIEIRHITLTNASDRRRHLSLTSYGEVVLAPQAVDQRHQAFNKLFIESEYLPELNALLFRRRPRSADETPIYLVHLLVVEQGVKVTGAYESDRACFLGRGQTPRSPLALQKNGQGLSGSTGATLDPIMALGQEIELEPHATAQIAYLTLAAESREEALALAGRYRTFPAIKRAFDQARTQSGVELRQLGLSAPAVEHIQLLLSTLLYPYLALRARPETLAANSKGQSGLWPYAISGDYPILLVRIDSQEELALLRELLQAHAYWRNRQIKIDLVVLNQQDVGYAQELHDQVHRLIAHTNSDDWLNRRGGIFLVNANQMSDADRNLLATAARVVLDGAKGSLAKQLALLRDQPIHLPHFIPIQTGLAIVDSTPPLARPGDLLFDNGLGGFSPDGSEYVIYLEPGQRTPAPWINVVANAELGFLVSEAGAGYTWAENSGENRLTPWRNDPVSDTPAEAMYLRDEETAEIWSPTPLPTRAAAPYVIRHGAGYSTFEHQSHGLRQRLRLFVAPDAPVKVVQLRLENLWNRGRRITATYYVEWVLSVIREVAQQYIVLEFDPHRHALLAHNPYNEEFGEATAFLAASKELHGLTTSRTEFLGRHGSLARPAALERVGLAGAVESGLDPCAALQLHFDLAPGEVQEVFFVLGQGRNREETRRLIEQYKDPGQIEAAWQAVGALWDRLLGSVTIKTPDPGMDLLLNRWLPYQTLSCRVWGRTALYQSSGAFGYRDQLQDVMGLLHSVPDLAHDHILDAARHQFEAGDVLHWWHPPSGRGVRTRISDDLLWLPFVVAHYVDTTGDESILTEKVPFLTGDPLKVGEEERYAHYETTAEEFTLYEHARRALDKGSTAGPNGLPLMGSGDWNDGMNRVGIGGKGESVWLGWFVYSTLIHFAPLCDRVGDEKQAVAYRRRARDLLLSLSSFAWDGNWYRRATYDDGTFLGSIESRECQIDSIAQSWAVLSGATEGSPDATLALERAKQAMDAVADRLVRLDDRLILLFTPPFDGAASDPGYIKGYSPGIRENGGQYSHAAMWAVWAFAELGQGDRAMALFQLLNPITHADTHDKALRYRVEPYVVAADVYSVSPHVGRGGWTWYTGSASWMFRLGLEAILGVHRVGQVLRISPSIPRTWPGYRLTYRDGTTSYDISVDNPDGVNRGVRRVSLDGEILPSAEIPLNRDGGHHKVGVLMG